MEKTQCYESEAITSEYAKHRDIYPKEFADVIMNYAFESKLGDEKKLGRMVEVGCGSGQITKLLAPYFDEVIASDVSVNQIKYAKESNTFQNVKYVVGSAEDIQVENQSADMVVSAESIFWFDLSQFIREVIRVLKPGGCLAIITYYLPKCTFPQASDVEMSAASSTEVMKKILSKASYNTKIYSKAEDLLAGVFEKLPSENKIRKLMYRTFNYNLADFKGYLRSLDAFQNKIQEKITESKCTGKKMTEEELKKLDLVEEFGSQLKRAWKMEERSDDEVKTNVTFEFAIVLAKNLRI